MQRPVPGAARVRRDRGARGGAAADGADGLRLGTRARPDPQAGIVHDEHRGRARHRRALRRHPDQRGDQQGPRHRRRALAPLVPAPVRLCTFASHYTTVYEYYVRSISTINSDYEYLHVLIMLVMV